MDTQKIKSAIIFLMMIVVIGGATFLLTVQFYKPKLKQEIEKQLSNENKPVSVVVANKDILVGSPIGPGDVILKPVPTANLITAQDKIARSVGEVEGKIATSNIYANEQIVLDKLGPADEKDQTIEQSDRYVTVDIPTYSFVNNKVDKGSLVDILVDRGNGVYDVVLSKVVIYDKQPVEAASASGNSNAKQNDPNMQPAQLNRAIIYGQAAGPNGMQNDIRSDNPAKNDTKDYRVVIKVTEKEQKRVFEASTKGKLMTRLYVLPNQPASRVTFVSSQEGTVVGDGTVPNTTAAGTATQTQAQTQTRTQTNNILNQIMP